MGSADVLPSLPIWSHGIPDFQSPVDHGAWTFKGIRFAGSVGWARAPASSAESLTHGHSTSAVVRASRSTTRGDAFSFFSVQTASRVGIRPDGPEFVSIPGLHCEAASRSADHGLTVEGFVLLRRILPLVDGLGGVHHAQHLAGRQGSSVRVCRGGRSPALRLGGVVARG